MTRPADQWLDGLREGGRRILPLATIKLMADDHTKVHSRGAMFRIERRGSDFLARWITPLVIIPCGARDETSEAALAEAFKKGDGKRVTRLYRNEDIPDDRCWLRASSWCLAYD